jgi:hypothetical protein
MSARGSGSEEEYGGENGCGFFEEEESDFDDEERNDAEEGQIQVDPLGRGLDVSPPSRRSGPLVQAPASSKEAAGAVFRTFPPAFFNSVMRVGAAHGAVKGYTCCF